MKPIEELRLAAASPLVDSHIHLDSEPYHDDWLQLLDRAEAQGVRGCVVPATQIASSRRIVAMAAQDKRILPAVGIHPHDAASYSGLEELRELAGEAVAIGETGLELFYDFCPLEVQLVNLRGHLQLALETGLPLILHCRDAEEPLYRELAAHPGLTGVVHCFTGPWEWAERFLELGFYLGVTGMVTYPKTVTVHEVARRCPLERMLVETDGPYLAPIPYRGRRNEPGTVPAMAAEVARLRAEDPALVAQATSLSAARLFGARLGALL